MTSRNTFTVYTEDGCFFDVRDIDDLYRMRKNRGDFSPTTSVFDDNTGKRVDDAPILAYNREEQERLRKL